MHALPTPDTPENWDAASLGYAEKIAPALMEAFADELVDCLDADAETEALEVGAGSGALTEILARHVKSLLATDFAPQMVNLLRDRMQAAGVANVTCQVMDGQALPLEGAMFDRAASSFAIMLFPDRAKGFSELRRILRPGGRAVVSGWAGPDKFELFGILLEAMRTAFPDMPPPSAPPPVFSLADTSTFAAEMEAAGFDEVEVKLVSRDLSVASFDDLWAMVTTGAPPVKMLLEQAGAAGRTRLQDTLGRIVEQRFGHLQARRGRDLLAGVSG